MSKKVNMQTIADSLGISKSVVSRALSDKYGVKETTRALIWAEANNQGYSFKGGKHIKSSSGKTVAVYATRASLRDLNYASIIISGIEKALNDHGIRMILTLVGEGSDEYMDVALISDPVHYVEADQFLVSSPQDTMGIIAITFLPREHMELLKKTGLPIVLVDFRRAYAKMDHVLSNNYLGMRTSTEYLINKGHRRLLYVGCQDFSYGFALRYHGCRDCVREYADNGVECRYVLSIPQKSVVFNLPEFEALMDSDYHPTAIVCANDPIAYDIYKLLEKRNLKIPQDISLIGFDDMELSSWMTPGLTTMKVYKHEMGEKAAEVLLNKIDNPHAYYHEVLIGVSLVERGSVADLSCSSSKNE